MKKAIYVTACVALLACCYVVSDIYLTQEQQIFKAKTLPQDHVFSYNHPFEEVYIRTGKDAQMHGLHFKCENPKGVVLYFHGRGWNLGSKKRAGFPEDFIVRGYDVLAFDYRGFGKSLGPQSEQALHHDAERAYRYALGEYTEDQITLYGMSFGTSIATKLAANHQPKQLILEAPYESMLNMAERTAPYLPKVVTSWVLKYHLRTDEFIKNVSCPINIFHGTHDELIPHISSSNLIDRVRESVKAKLVSIEQGDHDHLPSHREYSQHLDLLLH